MFILSVLLITGVYQYYWIRRAIRDRRKWAAIIGAGAVFTGTIASIESDYSRYGERLNINMRLNLPGKGDVLLQNWPALRYCPYAAGSEAEIHWSPEYPAEFIFANEAVWRMRGLNPVADGRIRPGVFKFRFFMTWAAAVAVILIGFGILRAIVP